jgi:DNA-binding CsgD family transcriptional regulator
MKVLTLEGTAGDRFTQMLSPLRCVAADRYCIYSLLQGSAGLRFTRVHAEGDPSTLPATQSIEGGRFLGPWDPASPSRLEVNQFRPGIDGWGDVEALATLPVWKQHYGPLGLRWERRLLAYDPEGRFLAWMGVTRFADSPPFSAEETRQLQRGAPALIRMSMAVATLDQAATLDQPAHIVVRPDGQVDGACAAGLRWLNAARLEALRDAVRRLEREEDVTVVYEGTFASPVRLVTEAGRCAYLFTLSRTEAPRLRPHSRLTAREREVADLAAIGATAGEISRHLGISAETVRTHLKAAYSILGVCSRVELASALRG